MQTARSVQFIYQNIFGFFPDWMIGRRTIFEATTQTKPLFWWVSDAAATRIETQLTRIRQAMLFNITLESINVYEPLCLYLKLNPVHSLWHLNVGGFLRFTFVLPLCSSKPWSRSALLRQFDNSITRICIILFFLDAEQCRARCWRGLTSDRRFWLSLC